MGNFDLSQHDGAPTVVVQITVDASGRQAATGALATNPDKLLALVPPSATTTTFTTTSTGQGLATLTSAALAAVTLMTTRLAANPSLAMAVECDQQSAAEAALNQTFDGSAGGQARLVQYLRQRLRHVEGGAGQRHDINPMPIIALRPTAVQAVGGFDPSFPGFGWADLVQRLRKAGWEVDGVPDALPFVEHLHRGLSVADHCRAEGLWLARHGRVTVEGRALALRRKRQGPGAMGGRSSTLSAGEFRLAMLMACRTVMLSANKTESDSLAAILAEARRFWNGPPPHEEQTGIGHRADWRFLLPPHLPHRTTAVFLAADDRRAFLPAWQWLVDDGWTERVIVSVSGSTDGTAAEPGSAEVALVGIGADGDLFREAMAAVGPDGALVLEQGRSPIERAKTVRTIRSGGFDSIDHYLVTPNLEHPKRYVPMADGRGLKWLLASPPPLDEVAAAEMPHDGQRLGSSVVNRVRHMALDAAAAVTTGPAGVGASVLGEGLIIATRRATEHARGDALVLITSGHDEGSRVVLAPLDVGSNEPTVVTKISARPAYNGNVDAEVARIHALRERVTAAGAARGLGFLPEVGQPFDLGALRASSESYAGRWTASDLCNRIPASRTRVLEQVSDIIERFAMATVEETIAWSPTAFDRYLGQLFDGYDGLVGPDPIRGLLRSELQHRSERLTGTPVPLAHRHYDLGPWNVVFGQADRPITIIDWELGPPRSPNEPGPVGTDQLYFTKYWLHLAMQTRSIDEELLAFEFLADRQAEPAASQLGADPRAQAADVLERSLGRLGVDTAMVPLLAAHVWLESGLHTIERRRANGIQPGSAARYLDTLARYSQRLLEFWPVTGQQESPNT